VLDRAATSVRLRALDLRDRVSGRAGPLVPPRRLDFVGHSDFIGTGDEFLTHFVELAGLQPGDRVLDVGCGIGRMARPLAGYLTSEGSYDGFDINRQGIEWCRSRYADKPNFRFVLADLHNRRYNPEGRQPPVDFGFPYADATFDLTLCTSVLTHLLEAETDHYLAEIARVLAPGGRVLATFFLLDADARAALAEGRTGLAFGPQAGPVAVVREDVPEEAVAHDRGWLDAALARHGLAPTCVEPGSWRGGTARSRSFQDLVVARRA
jgi:SAM-dependent methyltransferase